MQCPAHGTALHCTALARRGDWVRRMRFWSGITRGGKRPGARGAGCRAPSAPKPGRLTQSPHLGPLVLGRVYAVTVDRLGCGLQLAFPVTSTESKHREAWWLGQATGLWWARRASPELCKLQANPARDCPPKPHAPDPVARPCSTKTQPLTFPEPAPRHQENMSNKVK